MKKDQILENFRELIKLTNLRLENFRTTQKPEWATLEKWRASVINSIEIAFGTNHRNVTEFQAIQFATKEPNPQNITYLIGHFIALQKLEAMLFTLERWIPDDNQKQFPTVPIQPVIFIAHGGDHSKHQLEKLKEFIIALGGIPIIVEEQSNIPSSPSKLDKVTYYMSQCNCGIALITAEDKIQGTDEVRGRPNIDNEIGMMSKSENIGGKIILLKQNEVKLPSNYDELVWIGFTKKSMDKAFTEIIKNLRGFGFF